MGVAKAKGSVFGQSQDNFVVIPIETYFKIWGARNGMNFVGTALDHDHLVQAQEEARMLLRAYRHLGPKDDDTFSHADLRRAAGLLESVDGRDRGHGRGCGLGVPGGGRRGDHEHHAGGGHGAHARDRHPQIGGRAAAGTS